MTRTTPRPAATPVRVTMRAWFMPMAIIPAVTPARTAGKTPLRSVLRPPAIQSIPRAMQDVMTGMKRAK
ncbi:MAG: hypothetical protein BWX98_01162 [Candidatus Aminicenantes bacterium ADurb.Bin147]|nr:MAG: hypothetical protein BWX98_01162 [Candidatus Aminicenantes bacterium ADurb.Bin147]